MVGDHEQLAALKQSVLSQPDAPSAAPADAARPLQILTFGLGGEHYAIPLTDVRGIEPEAPIVPVPGTPDYLLGVYNLRGHLVAVVDLAHFLGVRSATASGERCIVNVARGTPGRQGDEATEGRPATGPASPPTPLPVGEGRGVRAAPSAPVIAGLLVDAVFEVVTVSEADVDPPIATLDRATAGVIRGEVMLTGRLTALIDVAGLFAALLPPESGAGRGA